MNQLVTKTCSGSQRAGSAGFVLLSLEVREAQMRLRPVAFALALLGSATMAQGAEPASFILNWVAGGDHAPYFYAQSLGWYKTAGIDLTLLQGKGSSMAAQAAGAGLHPIGL